MLREIRPDPNILGFHLNYVNVAFNDLDWVRYTSQDQETGKLGQHGEKKTFFLFRREAIVADYFVIYELTTDGRTDDQSNLQRQLRA